MTELNQVAWDRARALLWQWRGARLSGKVRIGPRCLCTRPRGIELGNRVTLEADVWFKIVSPEARLKIGDLAFLGRNCTLDVLAEVTIGDHTLFGPGCLVVDHNHGMASEHDMAMQLCKAKPIRIGRDVWCGAYVVVLPGVTIGDGAVIGAHAVVTKDIPSRAIAVGNPARVVGNRDDRAARPEAERESAL